MFMYVYNSTNLMFPQQGQGQAKINRKENEIKSVKRLKKISKRSSRLLSLKTTIPININYHMPNRLRHAKQIGIVFDPHLHDAA